MAWMREQWDKVPEPARQDSLRRYAVDPCWLVPLVMLCELLADEGRRDHLEDCLFPALFGSDFCEVATGSPEDARRGILLARLVIDPHAGWNTAGWDDPLKLRALEVCCQAEIARQQHEQQHLWLYAPEITRILLTIEEEHSSRIVTALADAAEAAGLQALTLDDTGLTDLSPLGRLTSLRSLFLNRTAVADLRPLEGLSELRSLHVRRTKVTSDAVSTLQRVLPQCEVDFEAGRAVVFLSSTFQDLREERRRRRRGLPGTRLGRRRHRKLRDAPHAPGSLLCSTRPMRSLPGHLRPPLRPHPLRPGCFSHRDGIRPGRATRTHAASVSSWKTTRLGRRTRSTPIRCLDCERSSNGC